MQSKTPTKSRLPIPGKTSGKRPSARMTDGVALPTTAKVSRRKSLTMPAAFTPQFWIEQDQRMHAARAIRQRLEQLREHAGIDSAQKEILAQRAIFISLRLESAEIEAARTGEFDQGTYIQAVNTLLGLLRALGLSKRTKSVDLNSYLGARSSA